MKVFISHAGKDDRIVHEAILPVILNYFEKEELIILDENTSIGEHWKQIIEGIKECDLFIVLLTKNSINNTNVLNEVDMALEQAGANKIIPILINTRKLGLLEPRIRHITPAFYSTRLQDAGSIEKYIERLTARKRIDHNDCQRERFTFTKSKLVRLALLLSLVILIGLFLFFFIFNTSSEPKIIVYEKPPFEWNPVTEETSTIAGIISNLDNPENFRIIIYAHTNYWYIQPYNYDSITRIEPDGKWSSFTHSGGEYLIMLVAKEFIPQEKLLTVPPEGGMIKKLLILTK